MTIRSKKLRPFSSCPSIRPVPISGSFFRFNVEMLEDRVVPSFTLDTTFSGGGRATAHFGYGDDAVQAVAVQPDGKIILAGFAKVVNDTDFAVVRLNADGTRDTSFGVNGNGRVTVDVAALSAIPTTGADDAAYAVRVDSYGRIVVAGRAYVAGSSTQDYDFAVLRLNPNGTRDTSFNGNGVWTHDFGYGDDSAYGVSILNNGDIVVGGSARILTDDDFAALRLTPNGSLDTSFGTNGISTIDFDHGNDVAFDMTVRPNGDIVLGGGAYIVSDFDFAVAQLNFDGSIDTSFGGGDGRASYDFTLQNDIATDMGVFADGSIGLLGQATIGSDADFAFVKFTPNGSLDTAFGNSGTFTHDFGFGDDTAWDATGDGNGGIIIVGDAQIYGDKDFAAVRISLDGQLDTSFGNGGELTQDFALGDDIAYGVVVQPDGKIILAGSAGIYGDDDFAAVRFAEQSILVSSGTSDSDHDGLLDSWETSGIDVNNDGIIDLDLPALGANPNRPDIFVEIDAMVDRAPTNDMLAPVVNAFNNAPVTTVTSAGTFTGIALHPIISDTNIPLVDWPQLSMGFPVDFDTTRSIYFGTAAERSSSNWANIEAARNLAFRYCIFANSFGNTGSSGVARNIIAQDFCVTFNWPISQNTVSIISGTFMHELGHTLGLHHHGNADAPNPSSDYLSVMNYRYQFGTENASRDENRLPNHPDYGTINGRNYNDWNRIVYNWRTGAGANAGLDAPRPAPDEIDVPPSLPLPPTLASSISNHVVVGSGAGGNGTVQVFDNSGTPIGSIDVFPGYTGGVRTATADFNGDGTPDIVAGTGPGAATQVRVLDGKTQTELFSIQPFEASFIGGVFVAAGDVTGDGKADLIITPDEGGGPRVRIFSGDGFGLIADFFGIDDPNFRGGARASIGDVNHDGIGDLLVAAGFGGGPRVAVFNGASLSSTPVKLFGDFFVFEQTLRNGVFITSGDLDGDGFSDVIVGGGPGGGPRVFALSGQGLLNGQETQIANFFGGDPNSRGGIRLVAKNLDSDARADLVVGSGESSGSRLTAYFGSTIAPDGIPPEAFAFDVFPDFANGVFVG